MTFAQPAWLWLLLLPVLLVVNEFAFRQHHSPLPFDHAEQPQRAWLAGLTSAFSCLPALLLAIAICLVAEPQVTQKPTQVKEMTNVEFVLDVSGSMSAAFGQNEQGEPGTRYDAAMLAIENFTQRREGDAFGLTIFGNEVLEWTPLTKDTSAIRNATPFLRPETLPPQMGGTEIGKALVFCRKRLAERGEGSRLLVLLSDGESADLGGNRAAEIGKELAADEVVLYAIHIGEAVAPGDLNSLASPTGGEVFAVADPSALDRVFGHIDQMQPIKLKPTQPQRVLYYRPFVLAALSLLALHVLASFGVRYSPW